MTIDELIEQLRKFKYDGISGETPVIVDCYDIPDGYRSIVKEHIVITDKFINRSPKTRG